MEICMSNIMAMDKQRKFFMRKGKFNKRLLGNIILRIYI